MVGLAVTCLTRLSIPADYFNKKKQPCTCSLESAMGRGHGLLVVSHRFRYSEYIDLQLKLKTSHLLKRNDEEGGEVTPN